MGSGDEPDYANAVEAVDRKIDRLTKILAKTTAQRPLLDAIEKLEIERTRLEQRRIEHASRKDDARRIASVTEEEVLEALRGFGEQIATFEPEEREALKSFLVGLVKKITLSPNDLTCQIYYEIPLENSSKLAFPRGFEPRYLL